MNREVHVRILWEPGGEIPPGYPTIKRRRTWLMMPAEVLGDAGPQFPEGFLALGLALRWP